MSQLMMIYKNNLFSVETPLKSDPSFRIQATGYSNRINCAGSKVVQHPAGRSTVFFFAGPSSYTLKDPSLLKARFV